MGDIDSGRMSNNSQQHGVADYRKRYERAAVRAEDKDGFGLSVGHTPLIGEIREALRYEAAAAINIAQERAVTYHNAKHKEPDFASRYAFISR